MHSPLFIAIGIIKYKKIIPTEEFVDDVLSNSCNDKEKAFHLMCIIENVILHCKATDDELMNFIKMILEKTTTEQIINGKGDYEYSSGRKVPDTFTYKNMTALETYFHCLVGIAMKQTHIKSMKCLMGYIFNKEAKTILFNDYKNKENKMQIRYWQSILGQIELCFFNDPIITISSSNNYLNLSKGKLKEEYRNIFKFINNKQKEFMIFGYWVYDYNGEHYKYCISPDTNSNDVNINIDSIGSLSNVIFLNNN